MSHTVEQMEMTDKPFKLYKVRWYVLILSATGSLVANLQWIQYSIIGDVVMLYYGVSFDAVNWTSMIYLLVYGILVLPVSYILDKYGIRFSMRAGVLTATVGAWIKVCSVASDRYWVLLLGQLVVALAVVPLMGLAPKVPAVWFGPNEVGTACGIGLGAIELGFAMGFAVPPMVIQSQTDVSLIENDLFAIALSLAIVCTVIAIAAIVYFPDKPKTPPSPAALQCLNQKVLILKHLKKLMTNKTYVLVFIAFGIELGIFCTISALLNQVVLTYYPDGFVDAGRIGLLMVIGAFVGSLLGGLILDKFKAYKGTLVIMEVILLLAQILFTCTVSVHISLVYTFITLIGISFGAIWSVSFELVVEATYPAPEATVGGLLNGLGQIFGICLTELYSALFYKTGTVWANLAVIIFAFIAVILVACVKMKYRRQATNVTKLTKNQTYTVADSKVKYIPSELQENVEKALLNNV